MSRVKGGRPPARPRPLTCPDGCGACCDPVPLPYTQADVRRLAPGQMDDRDRRWVLEHLTPIARTQAGLDAAGMTQGGVSYVIVDGRMVQMPTFFYSCDLFDTETRRCTAYEQRPPICRDYPWYGDPPDPAKAIPKTCVHRTEIGQTPVPIPTRRR